MSVVLPTRLRRGGAVVAALLLAAAAPAPAAAQVPATTSATCVGGSLGCEQADIFVRLTSGAPLDLTSFSISLTSPSYLFRFPTFLEAEDVFGLILANGTLSADRRTFAGVFAPTAATLDPTLRLRAAFDVFGTDVNSLGYEFSGFDGNGVRVVNVSTGPTSVVPEPATVLLLGAGLAAAGVGARVRARWRRG